MYAMEHLESNNLPWESMEVWETSVSSKAVLFQGCRESKGSIILLIEGFQARHMNLMQLVIGENRIQCNVRSQLSLIIVEGQYSEAKIGLKLYGEFAHRQTRPHRRWQLFYDFMIWTGLKIPISKVAFTKKI